MYNISNYSLLFFSEIKYRFYYIILSFWFLFLLCLMFYKELFVYFLLPLENSESVFYSNFFISFLEPFFYNKCINEEIQVSKSVSYDYYPLVEMIMINEKSFYFYLFFYFLCLFCFPVFLYHLYLFFIPSLFYHEYINFINILCYFVLYLVFYCYFLSPICIIFYLNFYFNQFFEFQNYEFDIKFDLSEYIKFLIFLYLCYIKSFFVILHIYYRKNWKLVFLFLIFILYNSYFFLVVIHFFIFLLLSYVFLITKRI